MGLAQLRQPSRLVADHSALLPVLQLYPLAMSFVYGIDPDSHLLGGWQLDPIKLKRDVFLCLFALLQKSNCDNPDTSIPWTSGKKKIAAHRVLTPVARNPRRDRPHNNRPGRTSSPPRPLTFRMRARARDNRV